MDTRTFDEYDSNKLKKALQLIKEVYEYNYGDPRMRSSVNRLETIFYKLKFLLDQAQ